MIVSSVHLLKLFTSLEPTDKSGANTPAEVGTTDVPDLVKQQLVYYLPQTILTYKILTYTDN